MSKILKLVAGGVALLLLLVIAAGVLFALTFDPNAYRDDITSLVRKQTGRELVIEGDLSLSFFPWLGFEVGATRLSNAPGFGDQPFAKIDSAGAKVKLLPLFSKQIEIGELRLQGLDLRLEQRADGRTNWDDLAALGEEEEPAEAAEPSGFATQRLGGIELRDARLTYIDGVERVEYRISDWDLTTGPLEPGQSFKVESRMDVAVSDPEYTTTLVLSGDAKLDPGLSSLRLDRPELSLAVQADWLALRPLELDLEGRVLNLRGEELSVEAPRAKLSGKGDGETLTALAGDVAAETFSVRGFDAFTFGAPETTLSMTGASLPGGRAELRLNAESLGGSLERETLKLTGLVARIFDLTARGSVEGEAVYSEPRLRGKLELEPFSPKALMKRLEMEPYVTADPKALTKAQLSTSYAVEPNAVHLRDLTLVLDDTTLTGTLSVADLERQALRFQLAADTLVVDRYLAPAEESTQEAAADDDLAIPAEDLRALNLNGTLTVKQMTFAGIRSSDVKVGLTAEGNNVRVFPSEAALYGGAYSGDIRIDAGGEVPELSLKESFKRVSFGDLSRDLYGEDRLTGTVTGKVNLKARGETVSALRSTLNGKANFKFIDGAFEGKDVSYEILRALALVRRESPPPAPKAPRTEFEELRGSATFTDGVMQSDDLIVKLPVMQATGEGTLNLVSREIDYRVKVQVARSSELASQASELSGRAVPVKITGTFTEPQIKPDVGAILKAQVDEKVDDLKARATERLFDKLGVKQAAPAETEPAQKAGEAEPRAQPQEASKQEGEAEPASKEDELKAKEEELENKAKRKLKDLLGGG